MAINVDTLFTRVNEDLARKDKAGYNDSTEFNRSLTAAEILYQNFCIEKYQASREISESLRPFMVSFNQPISNGYVTLPSDYRYSTDSRVKLVVNNPGGQPTTSEYPCEEIKNSQIGFMQRSVVRGAGADNEIFYFQLFPTKKKIFPFPTRGNFLMTYIRVPTYGVRAVTVDTANDQENYDANNSVQMEWNQQDQIHFEDILLYYKGIQIRDSEILQWIAAKDQSIKQNK